MTHSKDLNKNVLNKNETKITEKSKKDLKYEKQFVPRNSLLTDLYEINHIRCIYRIFATALLMVYVRDILSEIVEGEPITLGTKYIVAGFRDIHFVAVLWVFMMFLTLLLQPAFCFWATIRKDIIANKLLLKLWNAVGLLSFFIYCAVIIYVPLKIRGVPNAMCNNVIITIEQVRLVMKGHAFLRSNIPRVLEYKPHSDKEMILPTFSSFLYYYFAPTFIYRDSYPRTEKIRWSFVIEVIAEFIAILFWFSFLVDAMSERFQDFGLKKETILSILLRMIDTMLLSAIMFISGFYALLHTWCNIWAEILKFADRQFYEDWWNSTTLFDYFRSWNLVVHGYLHTYIYRDILKFILPGNRVFAACSVIFISGVVHEYIISYTFGFLNPILFVEFVLLTLPLSFVKMKNTDFSNYFLVWAIIFGTGIEASFYCMEYYARQNCPFEEHSFWNYFQMRMFTCNGLNL